MKKILLLVLFFSFGFTPQIYSQQKNFTKYWIVFKDKGEFKPTTVIKLGSKAYNVGLSLLTERAVNRRLKVLPENKLIDYMDLPVNQKYINEIKSEKVQIIAVSRWLNGVSAYLTAEQVEEILDLDYVMGLRVVDKLIKQSVESQQAELETELQKKDSIKYKYDYGRSLKQMEMVNVPLLHQMGFTGKGVMIASFDDGFDWRNHESLQDLNITMEYDFINEDSATYMQKNQKYEDKNNQGSHGTATLSTMSGFKNGKLVSPAFGSEIILAKTEYVPTETPMEEDFWLEAAEWAEALGVDIITSSLIYRNYDDAYSNNTYLYKHLNGDAPITSFAGDRCTYLGVAVFQAMGNYDQTTEPSLGSAADGDSVISVGAVMYNGKPANFTSNGPTGDGQMKPDVSAPGVFVYFATMKEKSGDNISYEYGDGTSFSTPITAGVAALLLEANPSLTPMQLREALRMTANQSDKPDNVLGWGVVNAYNAALYSGIIWSPYPEIQTNTNGINISTYIASNTKLDESSIKVFYNTDGASNYDEAPLTLSTEVFDANGSGRYTASIPSSSGFTEFNYYFYAKDITGKESFFYPKKD
ncbi:MAG TPA: S8 family serine peptidase [Ignavibacteria bacterium]|nr:S8 family serine peptidase [Ignavibacteria bacterium]